VGIGAARPAVADDDDDELLARRRDPHRRWRMATHPIKGVCPWHCRSPLSFLAQQWRPDRFRAFCMGLEHGTYCLGCCWFLMGLLFIGGIMKLFWIAGLAGFVLLEKTIQMGHWIGRIADIGVAARGFGVARQRSEQLIALPPACARVLPGVLAAGRVRKSGIGWITAARFSLARLRGGGWGEGLLHACATSRPREHGPCPSPGIRASAPIPTSPRERLRDSHK
jgi:hypothetical protein